jgi:arginyl-tRNA synthetase
MKKSAADLQPHQVAEYLHRLADSFNEFYQTVRVIQAENDKLKGARLKLVEAVSETLKLGMNMLAVPSPDKM